MELRESKRSIKSNVIDHETLNVTVSSGPTTSASGHASGGHASSSAKEKKIGHRRVDEAGNITYKRFRANELIKCIQTGIRHSVSKLASKPERDLLMKDFTMVERVFHKKDGTQTTPAHNGPNDFTFKSYAPIAFRYFRELFSIAPDDYMLSLCDRPMIEISNPGASGSIFYLTEDDEFILKTVMLKEAEFLQKLLPGYYMNLNQNPRTLLPKFFGLYVYQSLGKNVRVICMNNLLPRKVKYHQKFDLKGSTYKRQASAAERHKTVPTLKDLDFMQLYPDGIFLESDTYDMLIRTIRRDCTVLESFKIMDYSLLVGIHNVDQARREEEAKRESSRNNNEPQSDFVPGSIISDPADGHPERSRSPIASTSNNSKPRSPPERTKSQRSDRPPLQRQKTTRDKLAAFVQDPNTTRSGLYAAFQENTTESGDVLPGVVVGWNSKGERLLLYMGVIDILQCYKLRKKLEHTMKSVVLDGDSISVCHPSFYSRRFQDFMAEKVFRKLPEGAYPMRPTSSSVSLFKADKGTHPLSTDSSPEVPKFAVSSGRKSQKTVKTRVSVASMQSNDDGAPTATPSSKVTYLPASKVSNLSSKPDLIRDAVGASDFSYSSPPSAHTKVIA